MLYWKNAKVLSPPGLVLYLSPFWDHPFHNESEEEAANSKKMGDIASSLQLSDQQRKGFHSDHLEQKAQKNPTLDFFLFYVTTTERETVNQTSCGFFTLKNCGAAPIKPIISWHQVPYAWKCCGFQSTQYIILLNTPNIGCNVGGLL